MIEQYRQRIEPLTGTRRRRPRPSLGLQSRGSNCWTCACHSHLIVCALIASARPPPIHPRLETRNNPAAADLMIRLAERRRTPNSQHLLRQPIIGPFRLSQPHQLGVDPAQEFLAQRADGSR
jgi:hypothetical protein